MWGRAGSAIFLATSALLLAGAQLSAAQSPPNYAQQGWTEGDRNFWYSAPQGSRLMPLVWLRALERAGDRQLFLSPENIAAFGYLPYTTATGNALPVGFAEDRQDDRALVRTRLRWLPQQGATEPWVGFTCSACHTTEVTQNGRRLRIDGAPALGDFQRFSEELDAALVATRNDSDGKWGRFAARVLGGNSGRPEYQASLRRAVDEQILRRAQVAATNDAPLRYGFARLDAFGHIYNQTSLFSGGTPPSPPNLSNAPVSYPFLWNVPQHDRVQWNGSVPNKRVGLFDIGAAGRNAGEVVGVFGEVITRPPAVWPLQLAQGFPSSVNLLNLAHLEQLLGRLQPPAWPEDLLGHIDQGRVARGARVFHDHCASCHAPLGRTDLSTPIVADMNYLEPNAPNRPGGWPNVPPGTDPLMACNASFYVAPSGNLAGFEAGGARIQPSASVVDMLFVTVTHALTAKAKDIVLAGLQFPGRPLASVTPPAPLPPPPSTVPADPFPNLPQAYRQCLAQPWSKRGAVPAYKARPLTGIWATAPYLHNGSVPNLYELLLPAERRMPVFYLGTHEYDARHVGFMTDRSTENWFEFRTRDPQGNVIWGNFNGGHDYGNASLDSQGDQVRLDLLEYLKSL